ncbi:putative M-phase inducer phosphatase 1 [Blattamonas nauphoetae]|uniref:protein-tyrosine-phosphatase n=1 Tax=Blattamonas nauphoetae TaxID=2049346 RepID=A0ABQ9XK49_9EUKA|nr:putative M-phase inducer phosphatase 1 [Blattamonas nauphoetae]
MDDSFVYMKHALSSPQKPAIPASTDDSIWLISPENMIRVMTGKYTKHKYILLDTRYPYEYDGGHLANALNIYTEEQMTEIFFSLPSTNGSDIIIVFHCEFSSERAPTMAKRLRKTDRDMSEYPHLHYPQVYILEGGYHRFFHQFGHCPEFFSRDFKYISMFDSRYINECKKFQNQRPHKSVNRSRSLFNPTKHHQKKIALTQIERVSTDK